MLALSFSAGAQQVTTFTLHDVQGNLFNPATAGAAQHTVLGATYRTMWDGIDGGPQTALVFGNGYLQNARVGIGGYIYNDVTGPTRRTGLQAAIAYHIPLDNGGTFSLGLEGKFQQYAIDKAKLVDALGSDPVLGTEENRIAGDAGFGISYNGKKFQAGVSVAQLIQSKLDFYSGNLTRSEEGRLYRHYYFHSNYRIDVDGTTKLIPHLLLIYLPDVPMEVQGGVRVEHNDVFWWGAAFRARQSWMLSAGVKIQKKFTIGYSFDIFETPLSVYDRGSNGHEVLLKYSFLK
jgi:type IX secretion system PorP/SprF family membrane protein